jgi:3-oxoacyl-[acyl-carrier protein] reductase
MDLGIDGRVALVTGASRGIGRGIAQALAAEGARVAVAARSLEAMRDLGERAYAFDSARLKNVQTLVEAVERDIGPVEIYVSCTGGPPPGRPLEFTEAQWAQAHRTLVLSPMRMVGRVLPAMRARGFGRILVVSSSAAREPIAGLGLSNAHRPGLLAVLLKEVAGEVAADGVTINAVLPGRVATDRIIGAYGSLESAEEVARDEIPAGRLGSVEEIAAAAAFLCSAPASYITGVSLLVDGGLTRAW